MPIELRILSGARSGQSESFEKSVIAIGRHPMSDFRFDPKQDLDVSTRHGEIRCVDGQYTVHDANSTNGTFVNGERIPAGGSRPLRDNDVIGFGAHGPTVSVRLLGKMATPIGSKATAEMETPPVGVAALAAASPASQPAAPSPAPARPSLKLRRNTGERIAIAVAEQTRRLWIAIVAVVIVLGGTAAGIFIKSSRDARSSNERIALLQRQADSAAKAFETQLQGDTALTRRMKQVNDSLVRVVREAKSTTQAAAAEAALRRNYDMQRRVTESDFTRIHAANDAAIVLIASEMGGSSPLEATGFGLTPNGLLATNRHVVSDSGVKASSIKVKFANTGRWLRAHVVKLPDNPSTDLALLQIDDPGKYPTVEKLAPQVDTPVGGSVATIGYAMGTDLPMDGSAAKTSMFIGSVSKVVPDLLQIDAFATHGSSGSPVFDNHGHVVGVVWGGAKGSGERIVFSVPVERLNELVRAAVR